MPFERAVRLTEQYFGGMPRMDEPRRVEVVEPVPVAERRVVYRSSALAPRVEFRYAIPGVGHPDRPHVDALLIVAKHAIEDGLEEAGLAASVNANTRVIHTDRFGVPSTLNLEVILTSAADLARAETVMTRAIDDIRNGGTSEAMVRHARKILRTDFFRTILDPDRLAFDIGHFATMDRWQTFSTYFATRERTSVEDIQRLASQYFVVENRVVGIVREDNGGE